MAPTQGAAPAAPTVSILLYFHMYTSTVSFPVPTAGSKHKADDSVDDDRQEKWRKKIVTVPLADGSLPLKATWNATDLKHRKGLLDKFRVHVLSFRLTFIFPTFTLTMKGTRSTRHGQAIGALGELGRSNIENER